MDDLLVRNHNPKGFSNPKAVFLFNCAIMVQHGIILLLVGPVVPNIMSTFGVGEATTGILLGLGSLGFAAGPLAAGIIIDRGSVRGAIIIGFVIEIGFLLLFGLSRVFVIAVVANAFLHFGSAFIEISGSYLPIISPGSSRGHVRMNLIHAFFSVGAFVGPFLVGIYVGASGKWQPVFYFALVPTVILLIWAIMLRPRLATAPPGDHAPAEKNSAVKREKASLIAVLRNRWVVFGALALLFYVGAEVGVSSWIVYYLQQVMGVDTVKSAAGLSILWIFIMVGRYLNSILGNRLSAKFLVSGSGIGGFFGVVIFLFVKELSLAYVLLAWIGLCFSGVFPNVMGELNNRDPKRAGMVTAVMTMGAAIGAAVFQWVVGLVADFVHLKAALSIPAVLQLFVVLSFLLALRSQGVSKGK